MLKSSACSFSYWNTIKLIGGSRFSWLLPFALLFIASSCKYFKKKFIGEDELALARVNQTYLYPSDVEGITKGLSGDDSLRVLKAYTLKWVRAQLLLQKAKENIPDDDAGIMKKVEDYREQLLLYEYEKALIADKLDTVVKNSDLEKYYEQFNQNFPLQNDVFLVQYIKLKEDAIDFKDIKKVILSTNKTEEEEQKIEGYCKANATSFAYLTPLWYNNESLSSYMMLSNNELSGLISNLKFKEFKRDDGTVLFVRVKETKRKGEAMPLELAKASIVKILIEKRKMQLIDKVYERVYNDGISSKKAELFL